MIRVIIVLVLAMNLTGCPAMLYASLKNQAVSDITIFATSNPNRSWVASSGNSTKLVWGGCIIVQDKDTESYFSAEPIPENVVHAGMFSSKLEVMYKNGNLFFVSMSGELIEVNRIRECNNT
ncbi:MULTISPECIES: hypothetical protein [unclassified Agarivorans]|uniref:hypothetical protein n=1 Tax=unclassified Agarivorans TaxID=2636026 RepID=UPI0026E30D21|nr:MULTISPECIES: hypothetical protein [unclassified Agarivorans]MDO6685763.1 hypothetical protein [Agarivorans sp. 3_MG-2023]MDO6716122.1 hypothetical protein [Agarivorans sp. 2_MG-2023]